MSTKWGDSARDRQALDDHITREPNWLDGVPEFDPDSTTGLCNICGRLGRDHDNSEGVATCRVQPEVEMPPCQFCGRSLEEQPKV